MIKKLNDVIAKFSLIIWGLAAVERFTFWIIDLVQGFKISGGMGVYYLFSGLFEMIFFLVMLGVLLAVSVKISGVQPISFGTAPSVFPQTPAQQNVSSADNSWYCNHCGAGNDQSTGFCRNCGKPRQ